jgi:hypothetical protein
MIYFLCHIYNMKIFSSSLYSKWGPVSMKTGVSIMVASRTLDSWWTIAHNICIFFFFCLLQSSSQQEIYWAAKLWSSNWLRKNLNKCLNIQLKSIVTLFILGPRQIEIETINESTSFRKNESWQFCNKYHMHTIMLHPCLPRTPIHTRNTHMHFCKVLFTMNTRFNMCLASWKLSLTS